MIDSETGSTQPSGGAFEISRTFNAPRDVVFAAWTDAEQLKRWFGPKECPVTRCTLDFRIGGAFHYRMQGAEGHDHWGKWIIREITPPERLVFIGMFSDAAGGAARNPWDASWPLETLSEVTFTEVAGGTRVTVRWTPHNASDAERRAFEEGLEGAWKGWEGTFDRLDAMLAR